MKYFFTLPSLGDFCSNLSSIFWRHSELGLDELPLPTYILISFSALSVSPHPCPLLFLSPFIPLPTYPSHSYPSPISCVMSPLILLPSFLSPLLNAPIISSLFFHILPQSSLSQFILLPTRLSPKSSLSPLSLSLVCTLSSRPSHPFSHLIFLLSAPLPSYSPAVLLYSFISNLPNGNIRSLKSSPLVSEVHDEGCVWMNIEQ